jgi:hypothetical protein
MELNLSSSARRIISGTHPLRPLEVRNVPRRLDRGQAEDYIRRHGIPAIAKPDEFVDRLTDLEPQVGTSRAALVGLLSADKEINEERLLLGLKQYDEIEAYIPALPEPEWERLEGLYGYLRPQLLFTDADNNMRNALATLKGNASKNSRNPVGNCVICASIFTLLALDRQLMAGELRKISSYHSVSYLQIGGLEYIFHRDSEDTFLGLLGDAYENPRSRLNPDTFVIGSAFSLISALLISKVRTVTRSQRVENIRLSREVLERIGYQLACAEAINPFSKRLYSELFRVQQMLGDIEACDEAEQLEQALDELPLRGGTPAIML